MDATRHEGRTGVVDLSLPFRCERCGAQTSALVRTEGKQTSVAIYGVGGSAAAAQRAAINDAQRNAILDLQGAPCPGCGELQPAAIAALERASRRVASQAKHRLPLSIVAAVLIGGFFGWLGVRDLAQTSAGIVVAMGFALAAAAGTFAMYSWPIPRPTIGPGNVWFWWSTFQGATAWVAPPPVRAATLPPLPTRPTRVVSMVAAALAGLAGLVGIGGVFAWLGTVESVYVLANATDADALAVRVDGVATSLNPRARGFDVDYRSFSVRVGRVHRVEVITNGETRAFELDATKKAHGWLLLPFMPAAPAPCILEEQSVYGGADDVDPQANLLEPVNGVIKLPRQYDRTFQKLPPFATTRSSAPSTGSSKWAVRAASCEALANRGEVISFQARSVGAN